MGRTSGRTAGVGATVEGSELTLPLDISGAAASTDVIYARVAGDTNPRFLVNADGKLEWGSGSGAVDGALFRNGLNQLKTSSEFRGSLDFVVRDGGANELRSGSQGPGGEVGIKLGSAGDTVLYRSSQDTLRTDDLVQVKRALVSDPAFALIVGSEVSSRFLITSDGKCAWGDGTNPRDTNLYRSTADSLKTDDALVVVGTLNPTGALDHDGTTVGLYGVAPVARSAGWTITNDLADRTFDANATTLDELSDVVATLIRDLAATGIVGAAA